MIDKYDFSRAVMLLDAAEEGLQLAADKERRSYSGGGLRPITHQQRLETAREFVREMDEKYGLGLVE